MFGNYTIVIPITTQRKFCVAWPSGYASFRPLSDAAVYACQCLSKPACWGQIGATATLTFGRTDRKADLPAETSVGQQGLEPWTDGL